MCQRAAALPVLVDFLLLAAIEDYRDSPRLLTFSLPQSLPLSVCLTVSIHRNHSFRINHGHPGYVYQSENISAGPNKLSTSHKRFQYPAFCA